MRLRRLLLLLLLAIGPAAFSLDVHRIVKLREAYEERLAAIVKQLAGQHADLARWCEKSALYNPGKRERDSAVELDPDQKYKLLALAVDTTKADISSGDLGKQLLAARQTRVKWLVKSYLEVATWCRGEGLEIEFRRTLGKLQRLSRQDPDVRRLEGREKHDNEWFTPEEFQVKRGQRWYRGQWRAEAICAKSHAADLEHGRAELAAKEKLEFKAASGPSVDVFYTVDDARIQEELPAFNALFEWLYPGIFPYGLKEPLRVVYVAKPAEYQKLGQDPAKPAVTADGVVFALDTGKGPMPIVRELMGALTAIEFKKAAPGWLAGGLADFVGAGRPQQLNGKTYLQLGYIEEAQMKLLPAFKNASIPTLAELAAKTDESAGEADRACGETFLCWLQKRGLLPFFLTRWRADAGKKPMAQILEENLELPIDEAQAEFASFAKDNAALGMLIQEDPPIGDKADAAVKFDEYGEGGK